MLLNITPGADSLFIAGHSAANGRRAGVLTRHGRRTLGVLFVGLGVKLALADR